jgi:hypothetical protein
VTHLGVLEEPAPVVETDELRVDVVLVDELVVGEREHERRDEGDEVEEAEPDQPRGDEQQASAATAPLAE